MNIDEARKPVIIDEAGGIGMFGVGYQRACRKADIDKPGCYSWSDLEAIQKTIDDIKSKCRWCIVVAHAGEEFTPLPSPYTRERYLKYLEMGADIVVGHHPHVPMNYETVGDKIIFYSLGNFIFDTDYQRSQHKTEYGIIIKLNFTENEFNFEPMGLKILRGDEHIVKHQLPEIFQDVQEEDFNLLSPLSAKMHIEATPDENGGCVLYFTVVDDEFCCDNESKVTGRLRAKTVCQSDDIENIGALARALYNSGYVSHSELYSDGKRYRLILSSKPTFSEKTKTVANEFCDICCSASAAVTYEHWKLLASPDAIGVLTALSR
jgi:hypothetical protein